MSETIELSAPISEKESFFKTLDDAVLRGRQGLNRGIPHGFAKLSKVVPNIQRGTYYLIAAATKAGKTSFTDQMFLYNPYEYLRSESSDDTLEIDYYSLEISLINKIAKAAVNKIYRDTGIKLPMRKLLGQGDNTLTDEEYQLFKGYREYFDAMEDILRIHTVPINPSGVYKEILKQYVSGEKKKVGDNLFEVNNAKGTVLFEHYVSDGKDKFLVKKHIPRKHNHFHFVIVDHIMLLEQERGFSVKETIDKMSNMMVFMRNLFGVTPIVVQQLNYEVGSTDRMKLGRLEPMLSDLGDSKYTSRDERTIAVYCLSKR